MDQEKGNLSINSENFLPIIKKWLYTDKDIFVRELVSNSCDAVTKLKKLIRMGEAPSVSDDEVFRIDVTLDKKSNILKISDNGIGMTGDEIKKYINQIAFSGANDFLARYEEKSEQDNEIIGHFGLGFYSAFMVADKVEIDSLSFVADAVPAKWICDGGINYEMENGTRTKRGTDIILYLGEDGKEFSNEATLYTALNKYCAFMPVEIYVDIISEETEDLGASEDSHTDDLNKTVVSSPEELKDALVKDGSENTDEEPDEEKETPLNDTTPLWLKQPKECSDDEYKAFYHKVFNDMYDPLFWIHLNMDYPFRLKGILYFPKLVNDMGAIDGEVKLYSNQVYIADNIKEVIPEFLLILKGVIDCPDLPLNVSRSALQNDGYAEKMSTYISKKVADKINHLFKNERETYEKFTDDIDIFLKYGSMKEEKFYDKIKDSLLYRTTDDKHKTLEEYIADNKDKTGDKIFYTTDVNQQIQYINLFKEQGMEALILSIPLDKPFVNFLEYKEQGKLKFERIDADISDTLKTDDVETEDEKKVSDVLNDELQSLFRGLLGNEGLTVRAERLKAKNVSAIMLLSEQSRRMSDMKESYKNDEAMAKLFGEIKPEETLILNKNNRLINLLIDLKNKAEKQDDEELICKQVYDLALMGQKSLSSEEMSSFIERSNTILLKLAEFENK